MVFSLLDFLPFELQDGSFDMIGEFHNHYAVTGTLGSDFDAFGSILNIRFLGSKNVVSCIPKYIRSNAGNGGEYYVMAYQNKVLLFYSDMESNIDKAVTSKPNGFLIGNTPY